MVNKQSKIYRYDGETGEYIKEYNNFKEIKWDGIKTKNIERAICRKIKTCGDFWSLELVDNFITNFEPKTKKEKINNECSSPKEIKQQKEDKIITKIKERYSPEELRLIANGSSLLQQIIKVPEIHFDGDHIKFGLFGDTHIGSMYTHDDFIYQAFDQFRKEGVEFVGHTGDLAEGMSQRPGQIYELCDLGYDKQKEHTVKLLKDCPAPLYMIDGNHDRWFIKSAGALFVKDVCERIGATFLGHDVGDIILKKDIKIRLWHGEDASSYALSYRIQKVVESLTGGTKPHFLGLGHCHKFAYIFERNIHCVSAGSMQRQTNWMQGKRLAAHVGFCIIDLHIVKDSISRCKVEWFPFYC
jgi:predicted phosphodiesterase